MEIRTFQERAVRINKTRRWSCLTTAHSRRWTLAWLPTEYIEQSTGHRFPRSHTTRSYNLTVMEINPDYADTSQYIEREKAIFDVLMGILRFPAKPTPQSAFLAAAITFFCEPGKDGYQVGGTLDELWRVVLDIACCIPNDHPGQDSLLQCLSTLRKRGNASIGGDKVRLTPRMA